MVKLPGTVGRVSGWFLRGLALMGRRVVTDPEDWEGTFRVQIQILYFLLFAAFALFWLLAELVMGRLGTALIFGACFVVLSVSFVWAWTTRRMSLFSHLIMILALAAFTASTYLTGGLRTTNVCVFLFAMVVAPCTLGKSGLPYSAASVLIALGFQVVGWLGHVFPDFSTEADVAHDSFLTWFSSALGILFVLLAWEWLRAATRERMQAQQEALFQSTLQLREAQKMETVGRLAGGIAHDFNNLLTSIIGCAQLARDEIEDDHVSREDLDNVLEAANRAAKLTRQLLALSRRQVLKPAPINLNAVVSEMSDMLKRVFGELVTLETSLDPALSDAMLDPGQTEQVFMNLALNAHESMPEGGVLRIETENTTRSPPGENAAPVPMVVLRIADTGCGMSEDAKARIFDPFFSTKSHGTGLGLAVVHGIVKQHDGWIEVDSIEGEGTTFTVYLPATPSQAAPSESMPTRGSSMVRGRGERILVIEDEQAVRNFAEKLLHRAGYEVCVAETGEEAMSIIEADGDHLRLVFSDVVLPGMSGLEVARRVREQLPNVPVLLASGYSERLATKGAAEPLGFPFIDKPYGATTLLKVLRDLLSA